MNILKGNSGKFQRFGDTDEAGFLGGEGGDKEEELSSLFKLFTSTFLSSH